MASLSVVQGPDLGRTFPLAPGIAVLGRHSANAVSLSDPRASRRHCQLVVTDGSAQLSDLESGNGTLVNGSSIRSVPLYSGDRIQIGDTVLAYSSDAPGGSALEADRTKIVVRPQSSFASSILKSLPADAGSEILRRPELAGTDWLRSRLANLAVLYEASHAISDILDVEDLLGRIVELVVKATDADHGCAMVRPPEGGELMPMAVRSNAGHIAGEIVVSRTVMEHVLTTKEGVLITDAAEDDRFRGGESIVRHRIREVLCVPMRGRHDTVGVLFLDTRVSQGTGAEAVKFTEDHLRLAIAVAHQAALAVEENQSRRALLQAERLAAIGQTIAALSHHIKNIMQGVRFGSDMVRMALPDLDRELLTKGWRLVEKNQAKIDDLILDMLSFSKEREPLLESTDINGVVIEVLDVVRGRAGELGVELTFEPTVGLPAVRCDPDGMHHALLNIVGNAVEAVEGRVNPRVVVTVQQHDGWVEIVVADNGPGIAAVKLADIFKPFVSTKGAKGTGLGLPVSRKTLREHGGDVTATSEPGIGTRFSLKWPSDPPAADRTEEMPSLE